MAERYLEDLVDSEFRPAGGVIGAGVEELNWPKPVQPGDELRVRSEILDVQPSKPSASPPGSPGCR